ncbi:MAG: GtrA family protein [Candidatus Moraniibacteriota bacterium]
MDYSSAPAAPRALGSKKDYLLGLVAGLIIGLLCLPILKSAQPALYERLWIFVVPFFALGVPIGLIVASWIARFVSLVWQLAKFLVIGAMNTLVDLGVLAFITAVTAGATLSSDHTWFTAATLVVTYYSLYKGISFIIANINSYFWNKHWTFHSRETEKASTQFLQFFLVSIIGFAVNVVVASAIFTSFGSNGLFSVAQWGLIGAACGSVGSLIWNFIGYKFFVFKK